jgi:hypothetical protein
MACEALIGRRFEAEEAGERKGGERSHVGRPAQSNPNQIHSLTGLADRRTGDPIANSR